MFTRRENELAGTAIRSYVLAPLPGRRQPVSGSVGRRWQRGASASDWHSQQRVNVSVVTIMLPYWE